MGARGYGIVVGIEMGSFVKLCPTAYVCPSEIALLHHDIAAMLEYKEIDTAGQSFGNNGAYVVHFGSDRHHLFC